MKIKPMVIDVRKLVKQELGIKVEYKNIWLVNIGLLIIQLGCLICGANFEKKEING